MHLLPTNDDIQSTIQTYKTFFSLVYMYGLPVVYLVVSLLTIHYVLGMDIDVVVAQRTDAIRLQERTKRVAFDSYFEQGMSLSGLSLIAKGGPMTIKDGVIESFNNIMTYNGMILPRVVSIKQNIPLRHAETFSVPGYNLKDLQVYLDNVIYTLSNRVNKIDDKPALETIPGDPIRFWSLTCLFTAGVVPGVCDGFVRDFLDSFWLYELQPHAQMILDIFRKIEHNKQFTSLFCEGLINHIRISLKGDVVFSNLANRCGEKYFSAYEMLVSLQTVNNEIDGLGIGPRVFRNQSLNIYKVLSAQQRIFVDLRQKRFNSMRIDSYLTFIEELLKHGSLPPIYRDVIFLFNNDILAKRLLSADIASVVTDIATIKNLINRIEMINLGNPALGYPGVRAKLLSSKLQTLFSDEIMQENDQKLPLDQRFLKRFSFPFYSILDVRVGDNDTIVTNGVLRFDELEAEQISFDVQIEFFEQGSTYVVRSFRFLMPDGLTPLQALETVRPQAARYGLMIDEAVTQEEIVLDPQASGFDQQRFDDYMNVIERLELIRGFQELNEVMTLVLAKNTINLNQLYPVLFKNLDFMFQESSDITLCERLIELEITPSSCDDTTIIVSQDFFGKTYTYTFGHDKGVLLTYEVDNQELQARIFREMGLPNTNEVSLPPVIAQILSIPPEMPREPTIFDDDETPSDVRVLIVGFVTKYLGREPLAVLTKGGKTLIGVQLGQEGDETIIFEYDVVTNRLVHGYFPELGTRFMMENINLAFTDDNAGRFRLIAREPLRYFQRDFPSIIGLLEQRRSAQEQE
ncbi:MAG: hypothetical protein NZL83_01770 [Candidatus Absconditabacterales bacterium]|nr:hypothetical protein [Candidatus Absconditabacterales bacterium]